MKIYLIFFKGGAIATKNEKIYIEDCLFEENAAKVSNFYSELGAEGGALFSEGSEVYLSHNVFFGNYVEGGGNGGGISIKDGTSLIVQNCTWELTRQICLIY